MSSLPDDSGTNWAEALETRTPSQQSAESDQTASQSAVPAVEEYWRVARSAFGYDHSKEAVRAHTVDSDVLVDAFVDGELVGFCSCDIVYEFDQPAVYLNGAAVDTEFQGRGIGHALVLEAVSTACHSRDLDEAIIFATTQNPAIVSLLQRTFGLYPQPEASEPLPKEVEELMSPLAAWLDPDKPFDPPVIRNRYGGEMIYESIPEHPYRAYTDEQLQYNNGDAVLCAGTISAPP